MYILAVLITANILSSESASIGDEFGAASAYELENRLAKESQQNEAIARLYESVLDIVQVNNLPTFE